MSDKTVTTFWAGFSDGKVSSELIDDGWGGFGKDTRIAIPLFTSRKVARSRYQDVRKVKIVEVKCRRKQ